MKKLLTKPEQEILKNALEILEPIPSKKWIVNKYTDGTSNCCAIGHYTRLNSKNPNDFSYDNCNDLTPFLQLEIPNNKNTLRKISEKILSNFRCCDNIDIANINNGNFMGNLSIGSPYEYRVLEDSKFVNSDETITIDKTNPKTRTISFLKESIRIFC